MAECIKCGKQLPEGAVYCCWCGRKQIRERKARSRGNGEGTVYKRPNGTYVAVVSRYYVNEDGTRKKQTRSKTCKTKKEATAALPELRKTPEVKKKEITFSELYQTWMPTHKVGKSTMDCYKAAYKYFFPVWSLPMSEIDIDDLQECLDDCPKGKRTQQNMKALCGLLYKYAIPRHMVQDLNLAQYITVGGTAAEHRLSFTANQISAIKRQVGITPYADYVYCLIYLGFRPGEFINLELTDYDKKKHCIKGGAKTEAGIGRIVTISPKIQPLIDQIVGKRKEGKIFGRNDVLKSDFSPIRVEFFQEHFYRVLQAAKIDNPIIVKANGDKRHKYTLHNCRHTFSTLMKDVQAPSKDKLELMGHTSEEMLHYYQDVDIKSLKKITDAI